jgi:ATP/ADP translocase
MQAKPPGGGHGLHRKTELAVAMVLWAHLFLLIVVLVIGRSVGSALFLGNFDGRGLAGVYVLVGIAIAGLVTLFDRIRKAAEGPLASILTLLLLLVVTLSAGLLFIDPSRQHSPFLYGLFYLLIESFAFVTTVQFWGTANAALSLEMARRLYIFVATGGIFGSIAGGLLTRSISGLPIAVQIFVMAGIIPTQLLVLLFFDSLSRRVSRSYPKSASSWNVGTGAATVGLDAPKDQSADSRGDRIQETPGQPQASLVLPFGLVSLLMVFSTTLIDFFYKMHADLNFLGNTQELTWFFGSFYLLVGLSTLVTQLIVTPVILRYGTTFAGLWTSPLFLASMTLLNIIWPGVWPAAGLKMTDSVLSHSVYRSCQEMLYTPLPTRWVHTLKTQADGVHGRYGLILAGVFLFWLAPSQSPVTEGWLLLWILVSLGIWAVAIGWLRMTYRVQAEPKMPDHRSQRRHGPDPAGFLEALSSGSSRHLDRKGTA